MHRLILALLLLASPAFAEEPSAEERIRQTLESLNCGSFSATVKEGPELAAALQACLRKEPGGAGLHVVWDASTNRLFATTPIHIEKKNIQAWSLLNQACREAEVFWGLRNGAILLDDKPVTRTVFFHMDPNLVASAYPQPGALETNLSDLFLKLLPAVRWRNGERPLARYLPTGRMTVTTSEEHIDAVRDLIESISLKPRQVQVSATWVAYPPARVEAALSASPTAVLGQAELRKLFTEGEKRILHTQTVVALSGINAVTESVEEIIYPTEFDVSESDINFIGTPEPAATVKYVHQYHIPGAFETREIGAIFNVSPTVNQDNETINLQLLPEITGLERWIEYARDESLPLPASPPAHMPQPVFRSHNVTTSLSLKSGATLALSGGRDSKTQEYVYLYVNAVILNTDGQPVR